ncbi:MAG: peptidylprolyl isomerase, partial [Runella zeae]
MKKTFIHSLLLSLITVVGVYAQGKSTSINKVIAKVDNYYILRSELEELILQYKAQNQPAPNPCQALESLVVQKMLLAKAEIDSVIVEDKQVDNQVNARM